MKRFLIIAILLVAVPCWGADYTRYISESTGSEANDGTSNAQAWKELDHIEDDAHGASDTYIYLLLCGDVWSKAAGDWGNVGDSILIDGDANITVGAYYMDGGTPRTVDGSTYICPGDKPKIDGEKVAFPTDSFDSQFRIQGESSYITIQDVWLTNYDRGVQILPVNGTTDDQTYITLTRIQTNNMAREGIYQGYKTTGTASYVTVSYCEIYDSELAFPAGAGGWGQALSFHYGDNITINNNIVGRSYGEGIMVSENVNTADIYNNLVYNTDSVGIYSIMSHYVNIYNNYVIHSDSSYDNGGGRSNTGIGFGPEHDTDNVAFVETSGNVIRSNVVIGYDNCFGTSGGGDDADTWEDGPGGVNYVINNTFIDCDRSFSLYGTDNGATFQNNLFVINTPAITAFTLNTSPPYGYVFSGNGWDESEARDTDFCTSGDCTTSGDVTGDPDLVDPTPCDTNWRECTLWNTPSWGDAALGASSDFLGNATDLGAEASYPMLAAESDWPLSVVTENQTNGAWNFGAYEAAAASPTAPWSGVSCQGCVMN